MKIYDKIVQGTEDWFRVKWGKIGGTRAGGLFTKGDDLLLELLSETTEEFELEEEGFTSSVMQRGIDLQPLALQEAIIYTGINFIEVGWIEREDNNLLGVSPDGVFIKDSLDGLSKIITKSLEIKCPQSKRHIKTILDDCIPKDNLHQSIHYFTVNDDLEEHYFVSYRPEAIKKIFVKKLTRESFVNIGTDAKPVIKSINEIVLMAKSQAYLLSKEIERKTAILNF